MEKKLYRDDHHKVIGGVCAGLADYLNIDVTVVRLLFFLTLILKGGGGLLYIILWVVLPKKNYYYNDPHVDYRVNPDQGNNPFANMPPAQSGTPFMMPPKKRSGASLLIGMVLIVFGSFFLLEEFDILPDWDFARLWPVVLVVAGAVILFTGQQKRPWENEDWSKVEKKEDAPPKEDASAKEDATVKEDTTTAEGPADEPPVV